MKLKRTCVICKTKFIVRSVRQLACSVECSSKNRLSKVNARNRSRHPRRFCVICKAEIVHHAKGGEPKTCGSDDCREGLCRQNENWARRRCLHCGEYFMTQVSHRFTCSQYCQKMRSTVTSWISKILHKGAGKARNRIRSSLAKVAFCDVCDKEMSLRQKNTAPIKRYCSKECLKIARRKHRRIRKSQSITLTLAAIITKAQEVLANDTRELE